VDIVSPAFEIVQEDVHVFLRNVVHPLATPKRGQVLPDELEAFRQFFAEKRVAVITDFPYLTSGSDRTSGAALSAEAVEVRMCRARSTEYERSVLLMRAQAIVTEFAKTMSQLSVFVAFGDLEQCAAMKRAARACGLRSSPAPYVWDKSNKNAYFSVCMPGSTCVASACVFHGSDSGL
jgi:hypothetical protein